MDSIDSMRESAFQERSRLANGNAMLPLGAEPSAIGVPCEVTRCCGLDEVGRGALAGPLVAAAVILAPDIIARLGPLARFLRDSKTVPRQRRAEVAAELRKHALSLEVVEIPVNEINARGIGWANREAFRRLIERVFADEYVVDGRVRPPAPPERAVRVRCLVRADAQVPAVSAASLVAKVHRDSLMARLHSTYPAFGWDTNVGYGTAAHLAALQTHSPTPEHRVAFVATALAHSATPASEVEMPPLLTECDRAEDGRDWETQGEAV